MGGFVRMVNEAIGGDGQFADSPDVILWHQARGWQLVDEDDQAPEVPAHAAKVPAEAQWVNIVHAETGGTGTIPNDPAVIADHWDRGWRPALVSDQDPLDGGPTPIGSLPPAVLVLEQAESGLLISAPPEDAEDQAAEPAPEVAPVKDDGGQDDDETPEPDPVHDLTEDTEPADSGPSDKE